MSRALLYFLGFCYCICSTAQNLFEPDTPKNVALNKQNMEPKLKPNKDIQIKTKLQNTSQGEHNLTENNKYIDQLDEFKNKNWCNWTNLLSALLLCIISMLLISVIFI